MKMFRREQVPTATPVEEQEVVLEQPFTASVETPSDDPIGCESGYCAHTDFIHDDMSRYEELELEGVERRAVSWFEALSEARTYSQEAMNAIDGVIARVFKNAGISNAQQANNLSHMNVNNEQKSNEMACFRQNTIDHIEAYAADSLEGKPVAEVLLSNDGTALKALSQVMQKHGLESENILAGCDYIVYEDATIKSPYNQVFMHEIIARTELAIAIHDMPEVMREVLSPERISNLSSAMQALVALDINSGDSSVILQFMSQSAGEGMSFSDYIEINGLSSAAKEQARMIALGAQMMQGCECPLNSIGLCREVANKIAPSVLPADLRDGWQKAASVADKQRIARLQAFAKQHKITDWLRYAATIRYRLPDDVLSQTRREKQQLRASNPNMASIKSLEQSTRAPISREVMAPTELHVSMAEWDDVAAYRTENQDDLTQLIDRVMASGLFAKYFKQYQHEPNLRDFVRSGLEAIFTTPNYREAPSICPMSNFKPYYSGVDKHRLSIYRVSGRDLRGSAGKDGMDMRLYFGVDGSNGVRRIELIKIANKDDVAKQNRRGNHL